MPSSQRGRARAIFLLSEMGDGAEQIFFWQTGLMRRLDHRAFSHLRCFQETTTNSCFPRRTRMKCFHLCPVLEQVLFSFNFIFFLTGTVSLTPKAAFEMQINKRSVWDVDRLVLSPHEQSFWPFSSRCSLCLLKWKPTHMCFFPAVSLAERI